MSLSDALNRQEHDAAPPPDVPGTSLPPRSIDPTSACDDAQELTRLRALLRLRDEHFKEINERYMRNRAAAIALGSIYLKFRNELKRIRSDPTLARGLTDPARLPLIERMRRMIEERELAKLSRGRLHVKDQAPRW